MTTEINGRKVCFENEMTKAVNLIATCNACDRIIYEDEVKRDEDGDIVEGYDERGYCKQCQDEADAQE